MAQDNGTGSHLLYAEIDALQSETTPQLRQRWKALYGTEPPARASRDLLTRAVAYRLQERLLGGLSASTRRLLERIADNAAARRSTRLAPQRKLQPGTILLRHWGGVQHLVTVLQSGVQFRGKQYRSLSEVARIITGSRWSGPLFFGLKTRENSDCPLEYTLQDHRTSGVLQWGTIDDCII
jgi:hypothetical protein